MARHWVGGSFLALVVATALGCGALGEEQGVEEHGEALLGRSALFWGHGAGEALALRVCWKNPGTPIDYPAEYLPPEDAAATTTEREAWVREAVEQTWQAALKVDFVGWEACRGGEDIAIRIGGRMDGNFVTAFGSAIRDGEMVLNLVVGDAWRYLHKGVLAQGGVLPSFDFRVSQACNNFTYAYSIEHPEFVGASTEAFLEYYRTCVGADAVHEFGHALGFLHEQYRQDAPWVAQAQECHRIALEQWGDDVPNPAAWLRPGDVPLGPFDPESIMSYCRTDWTTFQPSSIDIEQAQRVYGRR